MQKLDNDKTEKGKTIIMLIKCIECNHDVSEYAERCSNCGCPIDKIKNEKNLVEDKKTVCPVCKSECKKSDDVCSACKFPELHREFINKDEEEIWIETVVIPFRKEWEENRLYLSGFDIEGTVLKSYSGNAKKVTIPDGVTVIGEWAFSECKYLTTVVIPDSVIDIHGTAFDGCENLLSIMIPKSVERIRYQAFSGCEKLTLITVDPENANYCSENGVLYSKDKRELIRYPRGKIAQSFEIPNGVKIIDTYAFGGCKNLKTITVPNSIYYIGAMAFSHCENLTSITIPEGVKGIHEKTFYWCKSLISVTLPDSLEKIECMAFYYCENLTSILLPNNLKSIGREAFRCCFRLRKPAIPNTVTSIGEKIFG